MMKEDPPFIGEWERIRILGEGSFGQVSLWKNKKNIKQIAIKKCTANVQNKSKYDYDKLKSRWKKEIDVMQQAKCDYIVRAINIEPKSFIDKLNQTNLKDFPLLVMEYCEGGDLRKYLYQIDNSNGLIEFEIKNIIKSLRYAIEYLHKNEITHRDLKPENILVQYKNDTNFYKLGDLGYAKEMEFTSGHSVVGTSEYIAPEILASPTYSKRVDYWSMGIIVFEIICGIRPFLPNDTVVNRMLQLKKKKSNELAIIKNINSEYETKKNLFQENQISSYFQKQIEEWLILGLEYNAKQRGSEFVHKNPGEIQAQQLQQGLAPDEIQAQQQQGPEYKFTFYTKLDEILNTKILTIFCLSSYKFLSYPVNNLSTLNDLLMAIEKDTEILAKDIYIILPMEQTEITTVTNNTRPIDLYLEDNHNSPMIYITKYKQILERTDPIIPPMIYSILNTINNCNLNLYSLKEFARQVLYFYRNEQKHYVELLKGLKCYAINLNDSIVKLKPVIFQVNNKTMIACGNIKLHVSAISYSKQKLEENNMLSSCEIIVDEWDHYIKELSDDYKFQELNARYQERYDSVHRRSKLPIESKLLEIQDFYNIKKMEEIYDQIRRTREFSDVEINKTKDILIQYMYDCIRKRKELLKSSELELIQKDIIGIHEEFVIIYVNVNTLNDKLDKYEKTIQNASFKHQDQLCEIYTNFTMQEAQKNNQNVQHLNNNIDGTNNTILINESVSPRQSLNYRSNNEPFVVPVNVVSSLTNGEKSQTSVTINSINSSWFGDMDDIDDIINENTDNLRILLSLSAQDPNYQ